MSDRVTRLETVIDRGAQRFADLMKRFVREYYPRALGSKKVPLEQRRQEWESLRQSPEALAQFLMTQKASLESAIEHAERMEQQRGQG